MDRYIDEMLKACQRNRMNLFHAPGALYAGAEGHKRLAREMGVSLNDLDEKEARNRLQSSYSAFYVRLCNLRPILDSRQWVGEMQKTWIKRKR